MRWGDMDAFAHVNNVTYLAYLEQARVAMFFDHYDSTFARGTLIREHRISYLRPVVYHPTPLRIEMWIERVRGASFDVHYEVFDVPEPVEGSRPDPVLAVTAASTCVTFDFATDRPRRLTGTEREILAGMGHDA